MTLKEAAANERAARLAYASAVVIRDRAVRKAVQTGNTKSYVAEHAGISRTTVYKILNGA